MLNKLVLRFLLPLFCVGVLVLTSLQMWSITEDYFSNDYLLLVAHQEPVRQTIILRYPNLFQIDIYLGKYQPHSNGRVSLLISSIFQPEVEIARAVAPAWATPYVIDGVYPFMFSPSINAVDQTFIISLETTEQVKVVTWGAKTNEYLGGQLLLPKGSHVQDLALRLHYRPGIAIAWEKAGLWGSMRQLLTERLFKPENKSMLVIIVVILIGLHLLIIAQVGFSLSKL